MRACASWFWPLLFVVACSDAAIEAGDPSVAIAPLDSCAALPFTPPSGMRVVVAECRAATASVPRHTYIMGCLDCEGATFGPAPQRLVTNGASLPRIPTTFVLRVADGFDGRVIVRIGGGVQVATFAAPFLDMLLAQGFATANVNHPLPGHPEVPRGFSGYRPSELGPAYLEAGRVLRTFVGERFGAVDHMYGFGFSRGMGAGFGTVLGEADSPYDGYVVGGFGGGYLTRLELNQQIWRSPSQTQPCTGRPTEVTGLDATAVDTYMRNADMLVGDPDYTGSALGYDASSRPPAVREAWDSLAIDADLQRPTVELHGLYDGMVPPILTLKHAVDVVVAGRADLYRLYLFKTRGHGAAPLPLAPPLFPEALSRDAVLHLDHWVRLGEWPADDRITERLASEAPELEARFQTSCQASASGGWDHDDCRADPYKWHKEDLQECPDVDHPKAQRCGPWACFFEVLDGP